MSTIKQDIKENFRNSIEDNSGIVGQVLKARREKQQHEKQVAAELSHIDIKTTRLKNDGRAFKKIEVSTIQISKNLQLINKWADVQVTTHEETQQALKEQHEQAIQQNLPRISIPDASEDGSVFDNILDLFDKMGKKIKLRFPKGLKKGVKTGLDIAKRIIKSPITRVAGTVAIGVAAVSYSKGLNTNEDKELEERRKLPPTITPPEQQATQQTAIAAAAAPPAPAPTPVAAPPAPAPTPVAAPPAPAPTPVAAPSAAVSEPTKKTVDVAKVAPAVKPPDVAEQFAAGKQETTSSSTPALSSVVKTASPTVSLVGIQSTFEKAVARMAAGFKQETGKTLSVTSGVRTNEEQKQLYDAKVAQLGGNKAAARKLVAEPMPPLGSGRGSMHLKGLAVDINSKGDTGINTLAGTRNAPTGWLEKFGLTRPVPNEDWHIQLSGTPPTGDVGNVPGKDGTPIDPSTGRPVAVPTDPGTGKSLIDSSKTVAQLKNDQSQRGTQTVVVTDTTNKTEYTKKKQPQGQTAAAAG